MAYSEALEVLQRDINSEEKKLGRYCRRCSYEGKKVLMHTASIQWTDDNHVKHFTPIALVCRVCRDWRWLPEQIERSKRQSGYIHKPQVWTEDGKTHHTQGFSKLEFADLMKELAIIRDRLRWIKEALQQNDPMMNKTPLRFDWKQFMKIYLEKV